MELVVPLVLAVNMMDEVRARGDDIDCGALADLLGVPVIPVSARLGEKIGELLDTAIAQATRPKARGVSITGNITYDSTTQAAIDRILEILLEQEENAGLPLRFFAGKLLEADSQAEEPLQLTEDQRNRIEEVVSGYEKSSPYGDRETMLADARYRYVTAVCGKAVQKSGDEGSMSTSDKIDLVLTNRVLAIPIFLFIMFLMFAATFCAVGEGLKGLVETLFDDLISGGVSRLLDYANAPGWTYGLLLNAVIGGVGNVLSFLPQVSILFLFLSILEDSGYMARAAFIMDRLLRKIGLTGKSFIPMLMGFGCTTPAVMAARTMENQRDRRLTIMITPFMSCGAKLPIYALFASVFFSSHKSLVVSSMYLIGW